MFFSLSFSRFVRLCRTCSWFLFRGNKLPLIILKWCRLISSLSPWRLEACHMHMANKICKIDSTSIKLAPAQPAVFAADAMQLPNVFDRIIILWNATHSHHELDRSRLISTRKSSYVLRFAIGFVSVCCMCMSRQTNLMWHQAAAGECASRARSARRTRSHKMLRRPIEILEAECHSVHGKQNQRKKNNRKE